jgi:hypothetical protein
MSRHAPPEKKAISRKCQILAHIQGFPKQPPKELGQCTASGKGDEKIKGHMTFYLESKQQASRS